MSKAAPFSLRQALLVALIATLCAILPRRFLGPQGLGRLTRLESEIETLRQTKQRLSAESEQLRLEADALKSDPRAIERVARGELGMVKPGEVVFQVATNSAGSPRSQAGPKTGDLPRPAAQPEQGQP